MLYFIYTVINIEKTTRGFLDNYHSSISVFSLPGLDAHKHALKNNKISKQRG